MNTLLPLLVVLIACVAYYPAHHHTGGYGRPNRRAKRAVWNTQSRRWNVHG